MTKHIGYVYYCRKLTGPEVTVAPSQAIGGFP
jgi:hypothetical protein